jgi:hypothetical protein
MNPFKKLSTEFPPFSETETLERYLMSLQKQFARCKTDEERDALWVGIQDYPLLQRYYPHLYAIPGNLELKEWILSKMQLDNDPDVRLSSQIALNELRVREKLQFMVTLLAQSSDIKHRKKNDSKQLIDEQMEFLVKHHTLLIETEADPEILEWILKVLQTEADTKNPVLMQSFETELKKVRQLIERKEVKETLATKFVPAPEDVPPVLRNNPLQIIPEEKTLTVLLTGRFEDIWRVLPALQDFFIMPIFEEDMIAFKSGTPFAGGRNGDLWFHYTTNRGLEISIRNQQVFGDVVQNIRMALEKVN